jgi:hypothetical protein
MMSTRVPPASAGGDCLAHRSISCADLIIIDRRRIRNGITLHAHDPL